MTLVCTKRQAPTPLWYKNSNSLLECVIAPGVTGYHRKSIIYNCMSKRSVSMEVRQEQLIQKEQAERVIIDHINYFDA